MSAYWKGWLLGFIGASIGANLFYLYLGGCR